MNHENTKLKILVDAINTNIFLMNWLSFLKSVYKWSEDLTKH